MSKEFKVKGLADVWTVRYDFSRAFANPTTLRMKVILYLRGWRPYNAYWWSKRGRITGAKRRFDKRR